MRRYLLVFYLLLFVIGASNMSFAQQKTLVGKVLSATEKYPIAGASITFPGFKRGSSTNDSGSFRIQVPSGVNKVLVSALGYKPQTMAIGSNNDLTIYLESVVDSSAEEIVVTTAGGIRTRKKEIGTAMTTITADVLTKGKATNIASGLQGKVPGMLISGVSGGVNPSYRIVLRGQRSLTGNNQALLVLDNVIVSNDVLGNLNPNDIEDITVLNGAGAAALYGSAASNGAVIVTTKKGKKGSTAITVQNTTTAEQVAFLPKLQKEFGAGGTAYGVDANGQPLYSYIENQSYGPKFNGQKVPIGAPLQDGTQDSTIYSYHDGHDRFWATGITNQTDLSISSGDDKSTTYAAGQYVHTTGTTPGDVYKRYSIRLNGTRQLLSNLTLDYNSNYVVNKYDITTQTGTMYDQMLNMPGDVDVTKYKNWRTDKFAMEDNFYNPWYRNPYFTKDNWRQTATNTYLLATVGLKYSPIQGLDIVAREGLTYRNNYAKSLNGAFNYSSYRKSTDGFGKTDVVASVSDYNNTTRLLITDLFAQYRHNFGGDFTLNAIAGTQLTQRESKYVNVYGSGMLVPVYNVSQATSTALGESDYQSRQIGVYGDVRLGYKGYLFLHGTGRNDWVSILNPPNNKFFYPSVDLSFIASEAISAIKNSNTISYLKLRAGWSKVGQVNLGNSTDNGAYNLALLAGQANGYPYNGQASYTIGGRLVTPGLKPEITKGYEFGFDLNLFKDRVTTTVTWYNNKTDNQTVTPSISTATGFSSLLLNGGQTQNKGLEASLQVTPVRNENWILTVGGNYTYTYNVVTAITPLLPNINLSNSNGGNGDSYAMAGQDFSVIRGYDYKRDPQGRVIVDRITGQPTQADTFSILGSTVNKNRLGLNFALTYKRLSLSAIFEYRGGGKIFNGIGQNLDWSGMSYRTAIYDRQPFVFPNSSYLDPSTNTYVKNTSVVLKDANGNTGFWGETTNRNVAANYVTSADFWKLREIALSYDVDPKLWGGNTKVIKGIIVSAQARNLFMWLAKDNYYTDPEYSSPGADSNGIGVNGIANTPPSRFYGATISVRF